MNPTKAETCVILLGSIQSPEEAQSIAVLTRRCPYTSDCLIEGDLLYSVFVLPADLPWWPDQRARQLTNNGVLEVSLYYPYGWEGNISSPWSRGEVQPVLPRPPCGASCSSCRHYQTDCPGCPVTRFAVPNGH